jgi:flavin reductase (DIM6/NTAB) family NADH-FMN oxidoreductase RutF
MKHEVSGEVIATSRRPVVRRPDPAFFRKVLARYPTGVTVITAMTPSGPAGMAVNSFTSASLDPPMILFCPARTSTTWPALQREGILAVNLLSSRQADVGRLFARTGVDRFQGIGWVPGTNGAPLLDDAVAWIECRVVEEYPAGDHSVVLAHTDMMALNNHAVEPLIFSAGRYISHDHPAPVITGLSRADQPEYLKKSPAGPLFSVPESWFG